MWSNDLNLLSIFRGKRGNMTKLTDIEYLQLSRWNKFVYRFLTFWMAVPRKFLDMCKSIWGFMKKVFYAVRDEIYDIIHTFTRGDWKTKVSYLIWGFGNAMRGQYIRAALFFVFEILFILYMAFFGGTWLHKMFYPGAIGEVGVQTGWVDDPTGVLGQIQVKIYTDDSVQILLMGLLTFIFIFAAIATWRMNVKQNKILEEILASGKPVKTDKEDLKSLVDDQFHKTLLALPVLGIFFFTVVPTVFMILVAFTNYDFNHDGRENFFSWVGWDNFNTLFSWGGSTSGGANTGATFGNILLWTLIWAFFATFTNYFLGMIVAMMINKKGIKLKKMWRGILVLSSAVPQFISLLYISNLFSDSGIINGFIESCGGQAVRWWTDVEHPIIAQVLVIVINIWIGIPYLMLITSGVLMNIPADLYESARIDGANAWQSLVKITIPYMFFVTGPYLLTSFTGNLNNFNVIFLLSGGGPEDPALAWTAKGTAGTAGRTDLLITWLFKMAIGTSNDYKTASVIGIMIFIVVAFLSLVIYNLLPSNKNEEDFS